MTVLGTDRRFQGVPVVGLIYAPTIIIGRHSAPSSQVTALATYVPAPNLIHLDRVESSRALPERDLSLVSPVRLDLSLPEILQ